MQAGPSQTCEGSLVTDAREQVHLGGLDVQTDPMRRRGGGRTRGSAFIHD